MDQSPFFALENTDNPSRFRVTIGDLACIGPPASQFMMGGVGLASMIAAMESITGRPLISATSQYLSLVRNGDVLHIDVELPSVGRTVSQARAIARVGERDVAFASAALGARTAEPDTQFVAMPEVPPPEDCKLVPLEFPELDNLYAVLRKRRAFVSDLAGHSATWIGPVDGYDMTSALLAMIADFPPGTFHRTRGSASLDNNVRVLQRHPCRWILLEVQMAGIASGMMHAVTRLFAEDGTLLAVAGQSAAVPRADQGWAHSDVGNEHKRTH